MSIKASYLADVWDYEVHILTLNEPDVNPFYKYSDKVFFHNIELKGNSFRYIIGYRKEIIRNIKQIQPQVISVCDDGFKAFFLPTILGKKTPLIYERHASIKLNFSNRNDTARQYLMHFVMQRLGSRFNAFAVLTKGNLKEWTSKNLEVIPNPLGFYPKGSSTSTRKRVIAVGTHSYNKGYDLLLLAWKKVVEIFPDWELCIFGKFDRDETFLTLAKELQIESSVYFSPAVVSIEEEYLKSSILVLPSRSEGFGMVLIEAMSCGLPCVAFDCPHGPADIIKNGEDGILVPAEDYHALAASLERLMGNENLRRRMGIAARQNVVKYLPENVMSVWDELFKSIAV